MKPEFADRLRKVEAVLAANRGTKVAAILADIAEEAERLWAANRTNPNAISVHIRARIALGWHLLEHGSSSNTAAATFNPRLSRYVNGFDLDVPANSNAEVLLAWARLNEAIAYSLHPTLPPSALAFQATAEASEIFLRHASANHPMKRWYALAMTYRAYIFFRQGMSQDQVVYAATAALPFLGYDLRIFTWLHYMMGHADKGIPGTGVFGTRFGAAQVGPSTNDMYRLTP